MEEEEKPSIIRKVIIIFISIFLLLLFLSYLLFNSQVRDIFESLLVSEKLIDNKVVLKDINITFTNESYDKLISIYNENLDKEFKVCLYGKIENNNYLIEEVIQPRTYLQTFNSVIADICDNDALIDLHSHPFRRCIPSDVDVNHYLENRKYNSNLILGVMCEKDRFYFYK